MNSPEKFMIVDLESTHKIIACAEAITVAFIKTDLKLNILDRRTFKMCPLFWSAEHDDAVRIHQISRESAFRFPSKKEVLREIFKWFNGEQYIFTGHFNREMFGSHVSFDYALLKQEFLDQSSEAYFRFGQMFPRQWICSTHSIAKAAHELGVINVPLVVKEGNTKASRDFGLKNIYKIMTRKTLDGHHDCDVDADASLEILKNFSNMMDIFEVIKNDWRKQDEQSDFTGKAGERSGVEIYNWWNGGRVDVGSDLEVVD